MSLYGELARRAGAGEDCALATVVATEGSAPAEAAMKMLVGAGGRLAGSVGGGRVEGAVIDAALATLSGGPARVLSFTLEDSLADEGGMICGGTVRILVERVAGGATWPADVARALRTGRRSALLARIGDSVERALVAGDAAAPHLAREAPRLEGDLFVEPLLRPRCIILGAGHVGSAVARVAAVADFAVAVVEDRPEHAARVEADEVVCAGLVEGFERLVPSPDDYVVVLTRGHGLDLECCRAAIASPARYVGMLASRKKAAAITEALSRGGPLPKWLHAPVGLDLGATSAGEIAVSIVAQLIKVRRTGRGDR